MNRPGLVFLAVMLVSCTSKKELTTLSDSTIPPETGGYLWVIKPTINLREDIFVNSNRLETLNDGDSVFVLKNRNGWYNVRTIDNITGWIRSDLLGPRTLSVYPKAIKFAHRLKQNEGTDIFFDKIFHHRRIFVMFPKEDYTSRDTVIEQAENLIIRYQNEVYPGAISVHVLKPDSKDVFYSTDRTGETNADNILPMTPIGRILDADFSEKRKVKLKYSVQNQIEESRFVRVAREMAGAYPISYREVIFTFIDESKKCLFWFKEDKNGEEYGFESCP
jgi:hypothetical protein